MINLKGIVLQRMIERDKNATGRTSRSVETRTVGGANVTEGMLLANTTWPVLSLIHIYSRAFVPCSFKTFNPPSDQPMYSPGIAPVVACSPFGTVVSFAGYCPLSVAIRPADVDRHFPPLGLGRVMAALPAFWLVAG